MPPALFFLLIGTVILAAGATVLLVSGAGWPLGAVALVALLASLRLWRRT